MARQTNRQKDRQSTDHKGYTHTKSKAKHMQSHRVRTGNRYSAETGKCKNKKHQEACGMEIAVVNGARQMEKYLIP